MERIKLNLIPSGVAPVVHVSQYDDGRTFAIDLFEGDNAYTLDGTEVLTVNVRKPDGHLVTESVTNTSDSYVTVDTTEQMTACHGTNLANLNLLNSHCASDNSLPKYVCPNFIQATPVVPVPLKGSYTIEFGSA